MKRPVLVIGISSAIATWASFYLALWLLPLLALGCLLAALPLLFLRERRAAFVLLAVLLAAGVAFALRWHHGRTRVLPLVRAAGSRVEVEGVVTDLTVRAGYVDCLVTARFPDNPELPARTGLLLRSFEGAALLPGDAFRCTVTLRELGSAGNYYPSRGVWVRGNMVADTLEITATGPFEFTRLAVNLRERMSRKLRDRLPRDTVALLEGMLLGRRDSLSAGVQNSLNRSGAAHLLAVSGLHLSILTGLADGLLRRLRCPRRVRLFAVVLTGFGISALVGFTASVFRAFAMLGVRSFAEMLPGDDRADTLSSLGLSVLVISLLFPHWMLSAAVWLSASSTAGVALFSGRLTRLFEPWLPEAGTLSHRLARPFVAAFCTTLAAYSLSLPILILLSGWFSLVSPLVNLLITPLLPLILGGGALLAAWPGAVALGALATTVRVCAALLLRIADFAASLRWATFSVDRLDLLVWVLGVMGVALLLLHWRAGIGLWAWAAAACSLCLLAGSLAAQVWSRERIELVALESCGAVVLLRGGEAVVVGTPDQYEIGTLLRYLEFRDVRRIAAVVATDSPERVGSGMLRLAERYEIGAVFGPGDEYTLRQLEQALPGIDVYPAGTEWMEGGSPLLLLGGARVESALDGTFIRIEIGGRTVVRLGGEPEASSVLLVFALLGEPATVTGGGAVWWTADAAPLPEPLGALLFGETRLALPVR